MNTGNTKSWWETGFSGSDRESEKKGMAGQPSRLWLPTGGKRQCVFIDDDPFCFWEHSYRIENRKQPEFLTCTVKVFDECPADSHPGVNKAEYMGHLTVVDCTGYVSKKDGKEHKFELIELTPKTTIMQKLKAKREKRGTLIGQMWNFSRTGDKSPSTGDDLEYEREVDMAKMYPLVTFWGKNVSEMIAVANGTNAPEALKARKWLMHSFQVPSDGPIPEKIPVFNYANLHAPIEPGEMRRLLSSAVGTKMSNQPVASNGAAKSDDDVPF